MSIGIYVFFQYPSPHLPLPLPDQGWGCYASFEGRVYYFELVHGSNLVSAQYLENELMELDQILHMH